MGKLFVILSMMVLMCTALNSKDKEIKTYQGVAQRSKAGLVVSGVMITCLSEEEMDRYEGKNVKVRGLVEREYKWKIDETDPVKKQGFNMPVMYKVISIEIIK